MNSEQNVIIKKLLLISENNGISSEISILLNDRYDILFADNIESGTQLLEQNYSNISAILLDSMLAAEKGKDFMGRVKEEPRFIFIPIILVASGIPMNEEIECLTQGALDIIVPPFHKKLIEQRIKNAVRLKDSASFYEIERMLQALPSNIYLKDADCRYIFATRDWYHIEHDNDPKWTIRGKTDVDIRKDTENALAAMEADKKILRTGKGTSYIIKIGTDEDAEFFEIIKEPVKDKNDRICGIVGLLNNVTEHERLRRRLKAAADTDGLTGLLNRRKIQSRIRKGLAVIKEKSGDRSLVMIDIDDFKRVNDTYGHNTGDMVLKGLAEILMDDELIGTEDFCVGRWGGEEFMLLLKNSGLDEAKNIAERIRIAFSGMDFGNIPSQTISLGVTKAYPDDTVDSLCSRVDNALYKAKKSGKNKVEIIE